MEHRRHPGEVLVRRGLLLDHGGESDHLIGGQVQGPGSLRVLLGEHHGEPVQHLLQDVRGGRVLIDLVGVGEQIPLQGVAPVGGVLDPIEIPCGQERAVLAEGQELLLLLHDACLIEGLSDLRRRVPLGDGEAGDPPGLVPGAEDVHDLGDGHIPGEHVGARLQGVGLAREIHVHLEGSGADDEPRLVLAPDVVEDGGDAGGGGTGGDHHLDGGVVLRVHGVDEMAQHVADGPDHGEGHQAQAQQGRRDGAQYPPYLFPAYRHRVPPLCHAISPTRKSLSRRLGRWRRRCPSTACSNYTPPAGSRRRPGKTAAAPPAF